MPYCPTCKGAFEDATTCPDDSTLLVDELPYQTIEGDGGTWVEIASASTSDEAMILSGFLEAEGIPSQVESLRVSMAPVDLGSMGEIRVYVAAENEQMAQDLLRSREKEYASLPDEDSVMTDDGPAAIEDDSETVTESEPS